MTMSICCIMWLVYDFCVSIQLLLLLLSHVLIASDCNTWTHNNCCNMSLSDCVHVFIALWTHCQFKWLWCSKPTVLIRSFIFKLALYIKLLVYYIQTDGLNKRFYQIYDVQSSIVFEFFSHTTHLFTEPFN